jgi:hypothetical protein
MRSALSRCSLHARFKSVHQTPWPTYTHLEVRFVVSERRCLNDKPLQYNSTMPDQSKLMDVTILQEVIWHTQSSALCKLALVCRALREPCQRTLLKTVHLCRKDGPGGSQMMVMLINQIGPGQYNIGLERFVQNIHFNIRFWDGDMKEMWSMLTGLLPHLTGLRSMTLASWCCFTSRMLRMFGMNAKGMFPKGFQRLMIHTVGVSVSMVQR